MAQLSTPMFVTPPIVLFIGISQTLNVWHVYLHWVLGYSYTPSYYGSKDEGQCLVEAYVWRQHCAVINSWCRWSSMIVPVYQQYPTLTSLIPYMHPPGFFTERSLWFLYVFVTFFSRRSSDRSIASFTISQNQCIVQLRGTLLSRHQLGSYLSCFWHRPSSWTFRPREKCPEKTYQQFGSSHQL